MNSLKVKKRNKYVLGSNYIHTYICECQNYTLSVVIHMRVMVNLLSASKFKYLLLVCNL